MFNIDSNGKVTADVRDNFFEFIPSYNYGNFSCFRVGNETTIHFVLDNGETKIHLFMPIDDVLKGFNDIKKNVFRLNDPVVPGEKSKPTFMTFDLNMNDIIKISATGPNEKNKSITLNQEVDSNFLDFLSKIVKDYINLVKFHQTYDDIKNFSKHTKHMEKLEKFVEKISKFY